MGAGHRTALADEAHDQGHAFARVSQEDNVMDKKAKTPKKPKTAKPKVKGA